jgi:hypothetical protein
VKSRFFRKFLCLLKLRPARGDAFQNIDKRCSFFKSVVGL